MLVSQVMVTDTVQWFWDPAIEWSQCLEERTITLEFDLCFVFAQCLSLTVINIEHMTIGCYMCLPVSLEEQTK